MKIPDHPPSFSDLVKRRISDLSSVTGRPDFETLVTDCNSKYRHWDKVRHIARDRNLDPELVWLMVKFGRQSQYRTLPLKGAGGEVLGYTVPDPLQRELMEIDRDLGGSLLAGDESPLDPNQRERFIISALREEAIASSMLEGAATTHRVAKEMLRSGRKPKSKGERMVANNYAAIQFVREHKATPLTLDLIQELHSIVVRDTLEDPQQAGRLRTDEDQVAVVDEFGELLHQPPPAHQLEDRLRRLCKFANDGPTDERFVHPAIRACALHFQFGVDHPFCDGNGRTARILFYWCMLRNGYWLFEYLPISRLIYDSPSKYVRAFLYAETDEYDLTYFLVYSSGIIRSARSDLREYIQRKQRELNSARSIFSNDNRLNSRQRQAVLKILRRPDIPLTIARYETDFAVSYGTANTDLNELAKWGFLERLRQGKLYEYRKGTKLSEIES